MNTEEYLASFDYSLNPQRLTLLEELSNASGVSGEENEVRRIVMDQIRDKTGDIRVDALGNVLAVVKSAVKGAPRVMLSAHMDEVGFVLVSADKGGLYRFEMVGGMDVRQLPGKAVLVGKKHVPGVIGARPIHLTSTEDRKAIIPLDQLRIDVGPEEKDDVKPGDKAVFATRFSSTTSGISGKALDNRLGVAILIELVKNPPPGIEMLAVFSTQEEIGARGARVAAFSLQPDLAFVLDSTPAYDLPAWDLTENSVYNTILGRGPAIYVADGSTLSDPRLIRLMVETGDTQNIPYQLRQPGGGGTDAGGIQRQNAGIPSISVSVPSRYQHTAVSVARRADWENTLRLLAASLCALDRTTLNR